MNDVWLLNDDEKWKVLEAIFSVPVEQRPALLVKMMKENKVKHLGVTDKTSPELATELIKKGIRATSVGHKIKKETK